MPVMELEAAPSLPAANAASADAVELAPAAPAAPVPAAPEAPMPPAEPEAPPSATAPEALPSPGNDLEPLLEAPLEPQRPGILVNGPPPGAPGPVSATPRGTVRPDLGGRGADLRGPRADMGSPRTDVHLPRTEAGEPYDDLGDRGATAPQLRRFIKSRAYVPIHELRRRFGIVGDDDEVTAVDLEAQRIFVGLPPREGALLEDLLRGGDIGFELSLDPIAPVVVGVYPMRPVPRG